MSPDGMLKAVADLGVGYTQNTGAQKRRDSLDVGLYPTLAVESHVTTSSVQLMSKMVPDRSGKPVINYAAHRSVSTQVSPNGVFETATGHVRDYATNSINSSTFSECRLFVVYRPMQRKKYQE